MSIIRPPVVGISGATATDFSAATAPRIKAFFDFFFAEIASIRSVLSGPR
jgi:hypothetical protein